MHPSSPAVGQTPGPPDPMQSLAAHLDDVMAQAEIAANAERDLGAETPTAPSTRQEAPVAQPKKRQSQTSPHPVKSRRRATRTRVTLRAKRKRPKSQPLRLLKHRPNPSNLAGVLPSVRPNVSRPSSSD